VKTIIYLTENKLDEHIAEVCRKQLLIAAGDNPIISVSQKPLDFGHNICVGEIGSSWYNIYVQQLEGLRAATTEFIAIAEHDVLYTEEHFNWEPPSSDKFYYNENCWLVEWHGNHPELDGMYSKWSYGRKALSQLICSRTLLIESIEERMYLLDSGLRILRRLGEPGAFPPEVIEAARYAVSGKHNHLSGFLDRHLTKFTCELFNTIKPNLDIRHKTNFTGPRRGKHRTFMLEPWGEFKKIMGE
jgi:hypothetical protein